MKLAMTAKELALSYFKSPTTFFCLLTLESLLYLFTRTMEEKYSSSMLFRGMHDVRLWDSRDRRHFHEAANLSLIYLFQHQSRFL